MKAKKRYLCLGGPFDRQYRDAAEMEGTIRFDFATQSYVVDTPGYGYCRFNTGRSDAFLIKAHKTPHTMILVHESLL